MKKILIVIHDMRIGGAQKSLLSFLQSLDSTGLCKEYDIHVLPLNPQGEFLSQIPDSMVVEMPDNTLRWLGQHVNRELVLKHFSWRGLLGETMWILRKMLHLFPQGYNLPQRVWHNWRKIIPASRDVYDVAIAYMDGTPSYYVMDKVQAKKKVLWLHNDYSKVGYHAGFDARYYLKCDGIITISEECKLAAGKQQPAHAEKIKVLPNITDHITVIEKSREGLCEEFQGYHGLKLLTVGRLHEQKGIDIAIAAAAKLRDAKIDFRWFVVGEGGERKNLELLIEKYELHREFILLGARNNPYPYMRACDILVQPSRYEGKSIVLDEAKVLCKPIIATAYSTVGDAITHEENGIICAMNSDAVAESIIALWQNDELMARLIHNLQMQQKRDQSEVLRYIQLMF